MLQNYDLEYHDFQYFWSPWVVCATEKRAAGLVQRTQGGGRHIRLEDHQLYYHLEFCRGTMYLISVNLYTIYIWCREGNYIYQKSKNVYKYPPFKLCTSKNHLKWSGPLASLIWEHDCTMCNDCLSVQIFSCGSKNHLKNNQDQGSLASSSPSQGVIFRSIGLSDASKGKSIGKEMDLFKSSLVPVHTLSTVISMRWLDIRDKRGFL